MDQNLEIAAFIRKNGARVWSTNIGNKNIESWLEEQDDVIGIDEIETVHDGNDNWDTVIHCTICDKPLPKIGYQPYIADPR